MSLEQRYFEVYNLVMEDQQPHRFTFECAKYTPQIWDSVMNKALPKCEDNIIRVSDLYNLYLAFQHLYALINLIKKKLPLKKWTSPQKVRYEFIQNRIKKDPLFKDIKCRVWMHPQAYPLNEQRWEENPKILEKETFYITRDNIKNSPSPFLQEVSFFYHTQLRYFVFTSQDLSEFV